jgi:SAM-dependent methyltransferase
MSPDEKSPTAGLDARLEALSPERRKLFELLRQQRAPAPVPAGPPSAGSAPAMIDAASFQFAQDGVPPSERIQEFYDRINRQLDASPFGEHALFLNYGYVPNDTPQHARVQLPDNVLNKNPIRLVLELFGDCELREQDAVLDVGCGRGAVCAVLRRYFQVGRYEGLDLSPAAIAFCQRAHRSPHTGFHVGSAERLPFDSGSFDVVTNVESSHGYPDREAFYREVHRVLREGGCFLYTDLFPVEQLEHNVRVLQELGLGLEREQDITGNVLLSCDETAAVHRRAFSQDNDEQLMGAFLGLRESPPYQNMKSGRWKYMLYRFRKAGAGGLRGKGRAGG